MVHRAGIVQFQVLMKQPFNRIKDLQTMNEWSRADCCGAG